MVINFLKTNKFVPFLTLVLRVLIGLKWMTAGWGKITSGGFDTSGFFQGALANDTVAPWWQWIVENIFAQDFVTSMLNVLVPFMEFGVGVMLVFGIFTRFGAFLGLYLNFSFLLSGVVSVNPQMILLTLPILLSGFNAGKIGLDFYIRPLLGKYLPENMKRLVA